MTTQHISRAPGKGINEDLIAVFESEGTTDLVVLDGATSVADTDYVDRERGDVAWFVQAFAAELEKAILGNAAAPGLTQGAAARQAVDAVRAAYLARTAGQPVPRYAYPLAALTWIRVRPAEGGLALALYCLGDCKAFAIDGAGAVRDLDPYSNPHESVLRDAIAALAPEYARDPAARRAHLLPMLRARREAQHGAASPDVLCLDPQGPFDAREYALQLAADSTLLAMTDGFYRLVDSYGLYTIEELARRCRSEGLPTLLDELRAFEDAGSTDVAAFKSADDASALLWTGHQLAGEHIEQA